MKVRFWRCSLQLQFSDRKEQIGVPKYRHNLSHACLTLVNWIFISAFRELLLLLLLLKTKAKFAFALRGSVCTRCDVMMLRLRRGQPEQKLPAWQRKWRLDWVALNSDRVLGRRKERNDDCLSEEYYWNSSSHNNQSQAVQAHSLVGNNCHNTASLFFCGQCEKIVLI